LGALSATRCLISVVFILLATVTTENASALLFMFIVLLLSLRIYIGGTVGGRYKAGGRR